MALFEIPELLLNILIAVKDPPSFSCCLQINKTWRETVVENLQEFIEKDVYDYCKSSVVLASYEEDQDIFEVITYLLNCVC